MKKEAIKEILLKNRLLQGIVIGVLSVLVIESVLYFSLGTTGRPASEEEVSEVSGNAAEIPAEKAGEKVAEAVEKVVEKNTGKVEEKISENGTGYAVEEGKIRKGEFFSTLMGRLGASQTDIYALDQKSKGVFDMRQIRVGYPYRAYYSKDNPRTLLYVVYEKDNVSSVVFGLKDSLTVTVHAKKIEQELAYTEVTITTSLWDAVIGAGAPAVLAVKLADNYAWSIDFFGLQKGDSFRALYRKSKYKDEVLGVGDILFSEFTHNDRSYRAYYFDDGSGNHYWNEKGESMRKAFLKAPLSYTRISSGFSYARRHPVTRKVRPHTGVDYAAPMGTEVMTIGDGVVIYKGRKKAEGNMVKIKHNSVYTTAYLHLSRYGKNVQVGQRVKQGEIIGYVGSTGYSTGPHLDFRIWKNGTPVNPLKMESPPANPINGKDMERFRECVRKAERNAETFQARQLILQLGRKLLQTT